MPSRRTEIAMSAAEIERFLQGRRVMNTATLGLDGRPHLVAMWYGFDASGRIGFATYRNSQKIKNLEQRPVLTGLVEDGDRYEELRGVQLVCNATVVNDADVVNQVGESLYERYQADQIGELTESTRELVHRQMSKRAAIVLEVVNTVSWDHTKLTEGAR